MTTNEFTKAYTQIGKHRRRCPNCGRLIQDGESADFRHAEKEKYYPVKGLMTFRKWIITHTSCE